MKILDPRSAEGSIASDLKRFVEKLQSFSAPVQSVEDGISLLRNLRRSLYEELNQIQHEYAALCAVKWLQENCFKDGETTWHWNPSSTGTADEPDLRGFLNGKIVISAEVTASAEPKGVIDTRMAKTLMKLASFPGQLYYFVTTDKMAERAKTKVEKANYKIEVVKLPLAAISVE